MSDNIDPIKLEEMRSQNGERIGMMTQDEIQIIFDVLGIMEMPTSNIKYIRYLLNERFNNLIAIEGKKRKERKDVEPQQPEVTE